MVIRDRLYTVDDLWAMAHQDTENRYELDEGMLVEMAPVGDRHGVIVLWLGSLILQHVQAQRLGRVTTETGYILSSDVQSRRSTVRSPNIGFIAASRMKPLTGRYIPSTPDLAVEVVSPGDTAQQMHRKARQYLRAGTRLVWVIYPDEREIVVNRRDGIPQVLDIDSVLDGEDVLPGFRVAVRELFTLLEE